MLCPTRFLCVSPPNCPCEPEKGVVHIPLDELEARQHELAPPYVEMQILPTGIEAYYALGWLHARGRRARLADSVPTGASPSARYRLWEPNEFLQQIAPNLPPGHALDLACGAGREAVYLADLGWHVVAVDWLPDALARGRDLQARYAPDSPPIRWFEADIENDWQPAEPFDLITCFFFLHRPLIQRISHWLHLGGHFLMETFTVEHRAHFSRPASPERVLRLGELPTLLPPGMTIRHYAEGWHARGHTARLWAQKVSRRSHRLAGTHGDKFSLSGTPQ
jgi:SAM-dependent methyltransferase